MDKLLVKLERYIELHLPEPKPVKAPCDGSILCERKGTRHKAHCLGRQKDSGAYLRELELA